VPAKQLTPFPGTRPLSTDFVHPDDDLANAILADYQAALAHARTICANAECGCKAITVSIRFVGFNKGWHDHGIKKHLRRRGVNQRTEIVKCQ
jgi:hypothetical protein